MSNISTLAKRMRDDLYTGEVCIATGRAMGTNFKILLKDDTHAEPNVLLASIGGFGQHGFYDLGLFIGDVFESLLELSKSDQPSVNFVELRAQRPLKALAILSIQNCDFYRRHFGVRRPVWRDYYYSMFYAGFTMMGNNFCTRMHAGSISDWSYQSSEIKCAIEAFVHYAKSSDYEELELVLGGGAFFSYHYGGYDYLDDLGDLVKDALKTKHMNISLETLSGIGSFSEDQAKELNLQRYKVGVPIAVDHNFRYSSLVRH